MSHFCVIEQNTIFTSRVFESNLRNNGKHTWFSRNIRNWGRTILYKLSSWKVLSKYHQFHWVNLPSWIFLLWWRCQVFCLSEWLEMLECWWLWQYEMFASKKIKKYCIATLYMYSYKFGNWTIGAGRSINGVGFIFKYACFNL